MADILIRGMEMPTHCLYCPLMVDRYETDACALQSQEANEAVESWDDLKRGCPLVPLQEGHGRLIDADALPFIDGRDEEGFSCQIVYDWDIEEAPTIVPAEGGT